jgi:hypothetical protein
MPRSRKTPAGFPLPRVDTRRKQGRLLKRVIVELEGGLRPPITARQRALLGATAALVVTSEGLQADLAANRAVDPKLVLEVAERLERLLDDLHSTEPAAEHTAA